MSKRKTTIKLIVLQYIVVNAKGRAAFVTSFA